MKTIATWECFVLNPFILRLLSNHTLPKIKLNKIKSSFIEVLIHLLDGGFRWWLIGFDAFLLWSDWSNPDGSKIVSLTLNGWIYSGDCQNPIAWQGWRNSVLFVVWRQQILSGEVSVRKIFWDHYQIWRCPIIHTLKQNRVHLAFLRAFPRRWYIYRKFSRQFRRAWTVGRRE